MHRNIPVKLPLRLNPTPPVTITYLDLANLNSGRWTCLPQVAHTTLNPSIEMNVECPQRYMTIDPESKSDLGFWSLI